MILSDKAIKRLIETEEMILHIDTTITDISSGVSSYGFDAKLGNKFLVFNKALDETDILDPKAMENIGRKFFTEHESNEYFILPPHSFALGKTKEYYKIPNNVFVICMGKSTYARCGLIINVTPLEPGWEGIVTLEFSNTTSFPIKLYVNEGICQFVFFKASERCEISYKEKEGKYMNQTDITLSRVK